MDETHDLLQNAYREATCLYMNAVTQDEDPIYLRSLINPTSGSISTNNDKKKEIKEVFTLEEAKTLLGQGENIVKIPDIDLNNVRKFSKGKCHWYVDLLSNFRDEKTEEPVNSIQLSDFSKVNMEVWNCVRYLRDNEINIEGNYLVDAYLVSYSICNHLVSVKHLMTEL